MVQLTNFQKYLFIVTKALLGGLFVFSGFIKLNDPWGTAYKMEEYFEVFAEHWGGFIHLVPFSLGISVAMCAAEVILGIAILVQYRMKITLWSVLLLLVFFTFLTFYTAYFNKVTNCGCFGDFLKLKPWTSFYKDVVLLLLTFILFFNVNKLPDTFSFKIGDTIIGATTVASLIFAYFVLAHLPLFDFSNYKVGNHLPTLKKAPDIKLQFIYVMKDKSGKEADFPTYPTDTTLEYVRVKYSYELDGKKHFADSLDKELTAAKIADFEALDPISNQTVTEQLFVGNKLIVIIPFADKANLDSFKKILELSKVVKSKNIDLVVLTSSDLATYQHFQKEVGLQVTFFLADATVLKTISRSNPGLLFLSEGTVKGKWHYNDVPTLDKVLATLK